MNHKLIAASLCAGLMFPALAARADEAADLKAMRAEMRQMQKDYAARMAAMEKRLAKAEADAKAAKTPNAKIAAAPPPAATALPAAPPAMPEAAPAMQTAQLPPAPPPPENAFPMDLPPSPPTPAPTSNNSFNPGIAAVLNGLFFAGTHDPSANHIAGIAQGDESGLPPRGFSLGESEISFAANIDPFLSGFLDISFDDANQPDVEEAYLQTKDLGGGFTLKGGRFLSGIGYINERHAHDWLFSDAPLPNRAFLNNQYGDDGLQVRWLAPTDQFLEFGAEVFRGDAFPAAGAPNSGMGTYTAFVHTGDDINDSSSWLAAVSYLHSDAAFRQHIDADGNSNYFNGRTDLGFISGVYKWAPGGNPTVQNLQITSEIFYDEQQGAYGGVPVNQDRWGGYVYGDYQFMPQWSVGLRYAMLGTAKVPMALTGTDLDDFGHMGNAATAMLEFDTSEFGRFRASYTHDEAGLTPNDELLFQYTVIYGPHGAHRY